MLMETDFVLDTGGNDEYVLIYTQNMRNLERQKVVEFYIMRLRLP